MKRIVVLTAMMLGLAPAAAGAGTRAPVQYGPEPDWERYKELAEPAVMAKVAEFAAKRKLAAPEAWSIAWPNGYRRSEWEHKGRTSGYLTCGMLLTATPLPRGKSVVNFLVVVDNDRVQTVDISTRESNSLINIVCQDMVSRGKLPPVRLMNGYVERRSIKSIGLVIQVAPEGAQVRDVVAGLPAARAGLASGMVITHANGIALGGMGSAMANVLASNTPSLQIRTAAGQTFALTRGQ